ncbi:MAG TPA: ATP-binding cassette domain-containing protein [Nitriliruptoraceae bacterium]|nr:ATP-binding cassette domain-containing protein [Nitriliruptoraceae bacterium]
MATEDHVAAAGHGASSPGPSTRPGAGGPIIEVTDLVRSFRQPRTSLLSSPGAVHALQGVTLEVRRGQRFGIVGESGSGKSTLLRLIGALDRPTSGSIRFEGREVTGRSERHLKFLRDDMQFVFQDPMGSLDPRMRVRDIVVEPLVALGRGDNRARLEELLDAVGLPATAADRYPHQFSGGQRQRIAIARALSTRPAVLLADEPVSALDVSVRAQILNLLAGLVRDFDLTMVFVSHDLSVVQRVCDFVAVMQDGRIVEQGATEQVTTNPRHPYTRQLLGAVPSMQAALAGQTAADLAASAATADTDR